MASRSEPGSGLQWLLGVLVLGWGLAILAGIVPHEDPLVGAGLAAFGAALAWSARTFPKVGRLPAFPLLALGALLVGGTLPFAVLDGLTGGKAVLLGLGAALLTLPNLQDRSLPIARGRAVPVPVLTASLLPLALGPAAIYAGQGLFARATGTTPLEAFMDLGLMVPLSWFLAALGWHPVLDGQAITYATPRGPLRLEVGVACSGLQAMAMFAGILAVHLATERPPPGRAAVVAVVGLGGVYACNLVRLALLAWVGHAWGAGALEEAHAQAGWVLFVAWALAFAWWVRRTGSRPAERGGSGPAPPA